MKLECKKCSHKWKNREGKEPIKCPNPKCRSVLWNRDKKEIPKQDISKNIVYSKVIIGLIRLENDKKYQKIKKTQKEFAKLIGLKQPTISLKMAILRSQGYVKNKFSLNFEMVFNDFKIHLNSLFEKKKKQILKEKQKRKKIYKENLPKELFTDQYKINIMAVVNKLDKPTIIMENSLDLMNSIKKDLMFYLSIWVSEKDKSLNQIFDSYIESCKEFFSLYLINNNDISLLKDALKFYESLILITHNEI